MEKLGVDVDPEAVKIAASKDVARCPGCGRALRTGVNVPTCPACGTLHFEPKDP